MLVASSLSKQYPSAAGPVRVLDQVSFELHRGDAAAVTGPSGCGKSTLLHLLGALDTPTSGSVTLDGQNAFTLNESAQALFRNDKIGFVFQDHCLLPQCTVLENVLAPTLIAKPDPGVNDRAKFLIDRVGLSTRAKSSTPHGGNSSPRGDGVSPVALLTAAISMALLVPSRNELNICALKSPPATVSSENP